jgi:copper resistance protein B
VLAWDGDALIGTDEWKLRWQSEGEYGRAEDEFETLENQILAQGMISDFFDVKVGVRHDSPAGPDRTYGVLGLQGLAPQWIEVDADLFVSEYGDLSARLDVDYELLITNRLILTPTAEINVAFADDARIGIGSGFSSAELGLRLGYDVYDRTVAPYVGLAYERKFGETADFAREQDEQTEEFFLVAGVRLMF